MPLYVPAKAPVQATAPASPALGDEYVDSVVGVKYFWNGRAWIPSAGERVLDQSQWTTPFVVPTSAVSQATAVAVPFSTITPTVPAGAVVRLRAGFLMTHGTAAAGWAAGRSMFAYIGDNTYNPGAGYPPVPTDAWAYTDSQVAGAGATGLGAQFFTIFADHIITAADAGTRTYSLYVYISNSALIAAQVVPTDKQKCYLLAESL